MRSIIAEDAQSALPIPPLSQHPRLDRVAAATSEQLSAALIFLSVFEPDAFDHSMDVAQPDDDNPGATGEAEPVCVCDARSASSWTGASPGGITPAMAQRSASSTSTTQAAPVVTWRLAEDLQPQE